MWARIIVLSLLTIGATAVGAAGSPLDAQPNSTVQVGPVAVSAGESDWTSVDHGQPAMDFEGHDASGVAPNMRLVIGDVDDPAAEHAFSLHNTGAEPASVSVLYRYENAPPSGAGVYVAVLSAEGDVLAETVEQEYPTVDIPAGETVYLAITVDTTGMTAGDDLSGTLSFVVS